MNKRKQLNETSITKRFPRLAGVGMLLTMALLIIGAVAAISKQKARAAESTSQRPGSLLANPAKTSLAPRQQDQSTQIKPLTTEEAQKLATALKELANQS